MPKITPFSWKEFVKRMKEFGFGGPFQEGRHPYMVKGNLSVTIPNPHGEDISPDLLSRILKQAMIKKKEWRKRAEK